MNVEAAQEQKLVCYLLGELPPEERGEIEERLFLEDGFQEELLATTDDLIRAYLVGSLSREERARFEDYFLTSVQHRERLSFIKDLLQVVERVAPQGAALERPSSRPPASPAWRSWAVAAAVLLACAVAIAGWLLRGQARQDRREVSTSPAPSSEPMPVPEHARRDRKGPAPRGAQAEQVVRLPTAAIPGPVVIRLSSRTHRLRLEVGVEEGGGPSYVASLRTVEGDEVWRATGLAPEASEGPLVVSVPARLFKDGEYTLRLEGELLRDGPGSARSALQFPLRIVRQP